MYVALSDNFCVFSKVSETKKYRTIITYKNYFEVFLTKQRQKIKEKIVWNFLLIEEIEQVPQTYLKHLEGIDGGCIPNCRKVCRKVANL